MVIADRYDASDALVKYLNSGGQHVVKRPPRPYRSNVMSRIESVSRRVQQVSTTSQD